MNLCDLSTYLVVCGLLDAYLQQVVPFPSFELFEENRSIFIIFNRFSRRSGETNEFLGFLDIASERVRSSRSFVRKREIEISHQIAIVFCEFQSAIGILDHFIAIAEEGLNV